MAWSNFKPPSGIPASGIPARGGPATGPGWGGPAKGVRPSGQPQSIAAENRQLIEMSDREKRAEKKAAKIARIATAEELKLVLTDIAMHGTHEAVRVQAANALLDRLEGKPLQTTKNLNVTVFDNLTVDEQRVVVEALDTLTPDADGVEARTGTTH